MVSDMKLRPNRQRGSFLAEVLIGVLIITVVTVGILGLLNTAFVANRLSREQSRVNVLVGFAARQYREQFGIPTSSDTGTIVFTNNGILIFRASATPPSNVTGQFYRFTAKPVLIDASVKSFDFSLSNGPVTAKQSLSSPIQ